MAVRAGDMVLGHYAAQALTDHRSEPTAARQRTFTMSFLSTVRMYVRRTPKVKQPTDIYRHSVTLLDGGELDLASLRGHPTLIVNTASKCGYTPQYEGLQMVYQRYKDRGLRVLGSPSADFLDQEYDEAAEIGSFCQKNYGVSFPLTERMSVRARPSPLWEDLARQPGSGPPVWNFTKYLVGSDGHLVARWPTKVTPEDPKIIAALEAALPR
ncbi:MAG: glutathione peroxidase [Solirubrobacteraceae bacterium]